MSDAECTTNPILSSNSPSCKRSSCPRPANFPHLTSLVKRISSIFLLLIHPDNHSGHYATSRTSVHLPLYLCTSVPLYYPTSRTSVHLPLYATSLTSVLLSELLSDPCFWSSRASLDCGWVKRKKKRGKEGRYLTYLIYGTQYTNTPQPQKNITSSPDFTPSLHDTLTP